jgi:hypothetical protein
VEIAKRIKSGPTGNAIVNLSETAKYQDEIITYIPFSIPDFRKYLEQFNYLDKLIFHPYQYNSYLILKIVKRKFPQAKVYWALWSSELYCQPPLPPGYYGPFSQKFIKERGSFSERVKGTKIIGPLILRLSYLLGLKKNHSKKFKKFFSQIDFFCSLLSSDFFYFQKISGNFKTLHLPFAYLSIENIVPHLSEAHSTGDKVMVGHSASPGGNHFEILTRLHQLNPKLSIFLPLVYGVTSYGDIIQAEAIKRFPHAEILRNELEKSLYYQKLTEVGWAIINVKVQQALGNITALIWMGVKVFLDEESSIFKDFKDWGIAVFSIQNDLNPEELTQKLTTAQVSENRRIIFEKCNENAVKKYWEPILN